LHIDKASFITLENSRSMMTTLASAWSRENAMIVASSRVFSVLSTPCVIGTP
jgi:hypothetical protein